MDIPASHESEQLSFDHLVGPAKGIKRILYKVFPRYFWLSLPFELHAFGVRLKKGSVRRRFKGKKDLKVNIGAGPEAKAGWINMDLYSGKGINCVYDCRKSLPFDDNSVQCIFTEHFVEHIDYSDDVPDFLRDCHRVLMEKGVIRIIVPDGGGYLRAYCAEGWDALGKKRTMTQEHVDVGFGWKYNTKMELINFIFRQGIQHKFAYDYPTLEFVLRKAGFALVKEQTFGKSMMDGLAIDFPERASESVYAEAMK